MKTVKTKLHEQKIFILDKIVFQQSWEVLTQMNKALWERRSFYLPVPRLVSDDHYFNCLAFCQTKPLETINFCKSFVPTVSTHVTSPTMHDLHQAMGSSIHLCTYSALSLPSDTIMANAHWIIWGGLAQLLMISCMNKIWIHNKWTKQLEQMFQLIRID